MKRIIPLLTLAVFGGFHLPVSLAVPITFSFSATGTGQLGAQTFIDTPFTITSTANTDNVDMPFAGIFFVNTDTAVVSIAGVGSGAFTNVTANVDNQILSRVGFSDLTEDAAILFVDHPALATYDLRSALGPLTGPGAFNSGLQFGTSNGSFSLTSVSTVTFLATIPEPAGAILISVAIALILSAARRR